MASMTGLPTQHTTRMVASPSLAQVLQSDPVKRLFNQPNIVIHAIPRNNSPTAFRVIAPKSSKEKKNRINEESTLQKPEVSIQVIDSSSNKLNEEENLLPSKNNGKSEILLVPIIRKRKECGHFEPCESLVCNIAIQHEHHDGIIPLVSVNISTDEIDAIVKKHCASNKCDALSIDHDRCRRASIDLHQCDKCIMCDICGITFQSRKIHLNHKKCRRKDVYQHNIATPSEIFKYRMRERELQILEAARLKRSCDYLDPVTGFSRTIEALKKNDELIIIPKMPPLSSEIAKFNFTPLRTNNNSNNNNNNNNNINNHHHHHHHNNSTSSSSISNNINFNNVKNCRGNKKIAADRNKELTTEMISNIILSCRNSIESSKRCEQSNALPLKHIKLSDHLNGATVNILNTSVASNQPCLNVSGLYLHSSIGTVSGKQKGISTPISMSTLNCTPSTTGIQENNSEKPLKTLVTKNSILLNAPHVTPLKIVPTAEMNSEPTIFHQKHGVPKFCAIPDSSVVLDTEFVPKPCQKKILPKTNQIMNSGKFRPLQSALSVGASNVDIKLNNVLLSKKQKVRKKNTRPRKKLPKKGKFKCTYCPKKFSSTEYCKLHIAKHENNPGFFCRLCEKGFLNKYTMKKHIDTDHKAGEVRCEMCNNILSTTQELLNHMKNPEIKKIQKCSECSEIFDTCNNLDVHMRTEHGFVICSLCKRQITKSKIKKHLMLEHSISKIRIDTKFDKLSYSPGENDKVCEANLVNQIEIKMETAAKVEQLKENKVESDCLARNRSVRRRSSKEIFTCTVCGRRFESEKLYHIHLANNPMKFTPCPDCGRKFHRKSEYTEHSKSCNWNNAKQVVPTKDEKKRKLRLLPEESTLKIESDNVTEIQDSIDQKQDKIQSDQECKKLKLEKKTVEIEDEVHESVLKSTVKIVNGLNQDSNDCLKMLSVIKSENNMKKRESFNVVKDSNEVLLLNANQALKNSNESTVLDKASVITSIIQDHNYQALK